MADPANLASNWGSIVAAIGALGTAACGLVDATKTLPDGGVSHFGFGFIRRAFMTLFGAAALKQAPLSGDLETLHGNWINGRPMADQQAIAKSLVKLRLTTATAKMMADATSVGDIDLEGLARKITAGQSLTPDESNRLGRFDLELTALIDRAYQRADQCYRNRCKAIAMVFALALAMIGAYTLEFDCFERSWWLCVLAGVLATPLAPITKDLASALTAGVKVAESAKS